MGTAFPGAGAELLGPEPGNVQWEQKSYRYLECPVFFKNLFLFSPSVCGLCSVDTLVSHESCV